VFIPVYWDGGTGCIDLSQVTRNMVHIVKEIRVVALGSWHKRNNSPHLRSPAVKQEMMKPVVIYYDWSR